MTIPAEQYVEVPHNSWMVMGKAHCHHCGNRSAKILQGPKGARPFKIMLCDACFKKEMADRGSIIDQYKPEIFDENKPYRIDQRPIWDAEAGRRTQREIAAEKRKYGVGGKAKYQRTDPVIVPVDSECHYCKKLTRRFGLTADGKTLPMCVTCGLDHDTTPKTEKVLSIEPVRYSTQWWNVQTEALVRDKGKCHICEYPSKFVDYVVPPEEGGVWQLNNAACICYRCNKERGRVVTKLPPPLPEESDLKRRIKAKRSAA